MPTEWQSLRVTGGSTAQKELHNYNTDKLPRYLCVTAKNLSPRTAHLALHRVEPERARRNCWILAHREDADAQHTPVMSANSKPCCVPHPLGAAKHGQARARMQVHCCGVGWSSTGGEHAVCRPRNRASPAPQLNIGPGRKRVARACGDEPAVRFGMLLMHREQRCQQAGPAVSEEAETAAPPLAHCSDCW